MGASQFSLTAATKKVPRANQLLPTILPPPSPTRHHYAHDNGIAEPNG